MNFKIVDNEKYYRKDIFRHFIEENKCSISMTSRLDVSNLVLFSKKSGTKFYINFLYLLSKVLNSRDDYKMAYFPKRDKLICYDVINPIQYVFNEKNETCTPVYTFYDENYKEFYDMAFRDIELAKDCKECKYDHMNHPNWFHASYIPWVSYDSLNLEFPDGYFYFLPIVNWGKYREENGKMMMPITVRLNHAIADGYLVANVFRLIENEMSKFVCN